MSAGDCLLRAQELGDNEAVVVIVITKAS